MDYKELVERLYEQARRYRATRRLDVIVTQELLEDEAAEAIETLTRALELKDAAMRQVEADLASTRALLAESRANDQTAMGYLNGIRSALSFFGDFPALVEHCAQLAQQEPVAWRYSAANGKYRYRGFVENFDKEYPTLKPVPLYLHPQSDAKYAALLEASRAVHEHIVSHPVQGFDIPDGIYLPWLEAIKGGA